MKLNNWYLVSAIIEFNLYCCLVLCGWFLKQQSLTYILLCATICFILYIIQRILNNLLQEVERIYILSDFIKKI